MAYPFTVSRRTWQPQGPVRVNPSYPYANNLRGAWLASASNLLANASIRGGLGELTAVGSPSTVVTPYGLGIQLNGSSQYLTNTSNSAVTNVPLTLFLRVFISTSQTTTARLFDISFGTSVALMVGLWAPQDGQFFAAQHHDGVTNQAANPTTFTKGKWYSVCGRFTSTSLRALFIDGTKVAENTGANGAISGIDRITIGYAPWSAGEYLNGVVAAPLAFDCALPDAEIALLHHNPWRWAAPEPRRLWWYGTSAGGGTVYDLTANNLVGAAPALGTPAITQNHVVTATALVSGAAIEGTPALSQTHVLSATNLTSSLPVLGTPALSVQTGDTWNLTGDNLVSGTPVLGTPGLTQTHAITALSLLSSAAVLGTAVFSQNHSLLASDLTSAAPVLGAPALLSDTYSLVADNLVGSAAILANPQIVVDTSTVTVESITASGGGGASTKRWMKESGLDDDIDEMARKLGIRVPREKKQKRKLKEEIKEVAEEAVEEQLEKLKPEQTTEFVTKDEFLKVEVEALKRRVELLERMDLMEFRLMKQIKRNEEEYLVWRALAERAI